MSYTVGNWTIDALTTDTISTPKSLSIPDLDFASDYSVAQTKPTEVRLMNTTGSSLLDVERLRYGRLPVENVYRTVDVPRAQQSAVKTGVQCLSEVRYLLKATNSVSGDEIFLPMRGWLNFEVPTTDLITVSALRDLLYRTIAAAFATGKVDGSLASDIARGDLDPTS